MSYGNWLPKQAPPPLAGKNGEAFFQRLGEMFDEQQDRFRQGVLARFTTKGSVDANGIYGTPPSDALDATGNDRGLPRATTEIIAGGDSAGVIAAKDLAYSTRLQAAWTIWDYAGSHYGVLRALQIAGFANMVIVQDNGRYSQLTGSAGTIADLAFGTLMGCVDRPSSHAGWMFDPLRGTFWAQFGILFTADAAILQNATGWRALNDTVKKWGPAARNYHGAWVILSGAGVWGWPTGTTLGAGTLGGDSTRVIPANGSPAYVI